MFLFTLFIRLAKNGKGVHLHEHPVLSPSYAAYACSPPAVCSASPPPDNASFWSLLLRHFAPIMQATTTSTAIKINNKRYEKKEFKNKIKLPICSSFPVNRIMRRLRIPFFTILYCNTTPTVSSSRILPSAAVVASTSQRSFSGCPS